MEVSGESEKPFLDDILREDDLQEALSHVAVTSDRGVTHDLEDLIFPASYTSNSPEEQDLVSLAENFWRQYTYLYPDRKPHLLSPLNECGVEKFVCSTLCATLLPYPELYNWEECARFVSEYLTLEPLDPPMDLPRQLFSSSTVLRGQHGSCFDFSVLLCSLLLGAGYDAYCVSGYASREMCLMTETREVCPLLHTPEERVGETPVTPLKKYSVKPPRALVSRFLLQQEAKNQEKSHPRHQHEESRPDAVQHGAADPLDGHRVHCWVLVLAGKREVPENFFIDAVSGVSYRTTDPHFLGIESLWNQQNYWVNMQDCRNACQDMTFDLGDAACWEFLLLGTCHPVLLTPDMEDEEEEEDGPEVPRMPPPWVLPIVITPEEYERRCPAGRKTLLYRQARLEKWARHMQEDGQVSRLTLYRDAECTQESQVQDRYEDRLDRLTLRQRDGGVTTESFSPGRSDALKSHTFRSMAPESERTMHFYSAARLDGLQIRQETPKEMSETFQGRPDLLCYRHTLYGKRPKKVAIAGGPTDANPRPILRITERFLRAPERGAGPGVAERVFLIAEGRIHVRSHREDGHISASYCEYLKPANLSEKGARITLTPETCISYQVQPAQRCMKQLDVYENLLHLQQEEERAQEAVRKAEAEVLGILSVRAGEEADPQITFSIYQTTRTQRSPEQRAAQGGTVEEEREARLARDYLAPYLLRLGEPEKLSRDEAREVREQCLSHLKQRLLHQGNLIHARYEKETQELDKKQRWYQQNQTSMSSEEQEQYHEFCRHAMFHIHIHQLRISRHKEMAPQKFLAMEERLEADPRLTDHLP